MITFGYNYIGSVIVNFQLNDKNKNNIHSIDTMLFMHE